VCLESVFPGEELFFRQLVDLASLLDGDLTTTHCDDDCGLTTYYPSAGVRRWQTFSMQRLGQGITERRQELTDSRRNQLVEDALQGANPSRQRMAVVGDEAPQLGCQGALLLRVKFKAHGGGGGLVTPSGLAAPSASATALNALWLTT
jgi:hypothetical protein